MAPNFTTGEIRGRKFQIWQQYFRIPPQKYGNQTLLVPNIDIFIFSRNFASRQIRGVDFKYDWLFWIPVWKYPNKAVFVLNVNTFYFCVNLPILTNSRVLISKMAIVFFKFRQKIPKYEIFFENSKVFFKWNFELT